MTTQWTTCNPVMDERLLEGAEGPSPETPVEYARRIRAMVHEASSHYSPNLVGGEIMNTALDLYAVALHELFGPRWREFVHPENGDILRHYIEDPSRWETLMRVS